MAPYLSMNDAAGAIEFYKEVFGAEEVFRLVLPNGKICHAEIKIKGHPVMLGEAHPGMSKSPVELGGTPVRVCLMVDDVDAVMNSAQKSGATVISPAENHFYGHRSGSIRDPFGHEWMLNHELEKVAPDEMQRRFAEMINS